VEKYKFQKLQVYQLALEYADAVHGMSERLPQKERFNLSSQIERASTSIVLNIAEGSTGQFQRYAVGCLHLWCGTGEYRVAEYTCTPSGP
jgi:hypothetical protein